MEKYLFPHITLSFTEFVADFIIDDKGKWWFIQVKSFQITEESRNNIMYYQKSLEDALREYGEYADIRDRNDHRPESLKGMSAKEKQIYLTKKSLPNGKICSFCGVRYQDDRKVVDTIGENLSVLVPEFGYSISYNMLKETLNHLIKRGCNIDIFNLFSSKTLTCKPYENLLVCKLCYDLYTKTQQLMNIEKKFVSFLGINLKSDNIPTYPGSVIVGRDELKGNVKQFRIMIFLHELFTLSSEKHRRLLRSLDSSPFEIIYYIINRPYSFKYDLDISDKGTYAIRHVRLFYIFSTEEEFLKIIKDNIFKIEIWKKGEKIGFTSCKLDKLCIPGIDSEDGRKLSVQLYLSTKILGDMGLKLSLCIKEDINIKPPDNIQFCYINGLYYPRDNYYDSSAIPDSWISAVGKDPRITGIVRNDNDNKMIKEVPFINIPHGFTTKSFAKNMNDSQERKRKRKSIFRRIFNSVMSVNCKVVDCALLKHSLTVQV